jgi:transposase
VELYVGLDVSLELTSVCVVDRGGKTLWEGKCASTPEAIDATIRARAPGVMRVGLESGPLSAWHWHELRKLGCGNLPGCASCQGRAVAADEQIRPQRRARPGADRKNWLVSRGRSQGVDSQMIRTLLTTRAQLVRMRVDLANQIRGVLKPFGLLAGKGSGQPFIERARDLVAGGPLEEVVEALLSAWLAINSQIGILSRRLTMIARADQMVKRLMTAPGVGVLVGLAYISVIDDPKRFAKSSSVGAYIGLTPRRFQSGEDDYSSHISRFWS